MLRVAPRVRMGVETVALPPSPQLGRRGATNPSFGPTQPNLVMLSYALLFFIVAVIAAALGFGGLAGTAATVAKVLFVIFLILFLISLVTGRRPRP